MKFWLDKNKLSLNLNNSKLMLFGNSSLNTNAKIQINGVDIERVSENKFLGVIIDEKLNWRAHVRYIHSKVSRSIAILNKAKQVFDRTSLHILYCSLVSPYLSYCAEVWGNNYKTTLHSLFTLQKKAIRIIHNAGYREHTNSLFLQSEILKMDDLVKFQTAQILFKAKNKELPGNIQSMFFLKEGSYNLRGFCNFKTGKVRTTRKSFCVSVHGVKLWNSLNMELKQCPNIKQFKKSYKNMIFSNYKEKENIEIK